MTASFEEEVIRTIKRLRPGEVASYGEIAAEAGFPRAARAVGTVLARTSDLPWWRIVRADGRLVAPRQDLQARLLRKEGVAVVDGKVRVNSPGTDPLRKR
jgi:methylated-DNA-protein-cysteine methyltransferase related protein